MVKSFYEGSKILIPMVDGSAGKPYGFPGLMSMVNGTVAKRTETVMGGRVTMGEKSLRDRKIPIDRLVVSSSKGAIKSRKTPDYDNSSKLRKLNPDKYPGVTGCCESLLAAMRLIKGFFSGRPSDLAKLLHHVTFFVVNLYHVYQQDPSRWLSYSRRKMNYTGKDSTEYKDKFKLSYDYSVNKVIKFLLDNCTLSSLRSSTSREIR